MPEKVRGFDSLVCSLEISRAPSVRLVTVLLFVRSIFGAHMLAAYTSLEVNV